MTRHGGDMDGKAPGAASREEHLYVENCELLKHVCFLALFIFIWSLETIYSDAIYDNSFSKFIQVFSLVFLPGNLWVFLIA